jgi:MFS family permease
MPSRLMVDLEPLKESRDFRLLFSSYLISMLGNQMTTVAIPFQTFELTHSSLQVGLVSLAQLVPLIIGSLLGGTAGDALDRKRIILYTSLASAITSGAMALNAAAAHPSLLELYLISALAAGLVGFANPSRNAAVAVLVRPTSLVAAYSLNQMVIQVAVIVGPMMAGLLLAGPGLAWTYGLDAASFIVAAGAIVFLRPMPPEHEGGRPGLSAIAQGFRYLRGRKVIQGIFALDLDAMIFGMPRALFPAMAAEIYHVGTTGLGLLYAAPGVGALIGAGTTGWVNEITRRGRAVAVAVALWGVSITVFGLSDSFIVGLVMLALAGWADVISAVLRSTMLQTRIPDSFRSRLSSFQMAVVTGGPRLGDLEAGTVAAVSSTEFSVVSGGIACILGAVALARLLPDFWSERSGDVEAPTEP